MLLKLSVLILYLKATLKNAAYGCAQKMYDLRVKVEATQYPEVQIGLFP